MSTKNCPPENHLTEFINGQLVDSDIAEIAGHLDSCSDCQQTLKTLASSDTLVDCLLGEDTAVEKMLRKLPRSLLDELNQISAKLSPDGREPNLSSNGLYAVRGTQAPLSYSNAPSAEEQWFGHYRVTQVLGTGGMGKVFRAEDTQLHRPVAIKAILPRLAAEPTAKERFLREARAAASLVSDHIVRVYHVGEENGLPFIATELLQGQSLDDAMRTGRRFTISEILNIARQVLQGLSVAHANGLVHRDIKPANLWLETLSKNSGSSAFRMKILDFGLARADWDESQLTHASTIIGTPAFMAPEQGRGSKAVDYRSDLFSLGCVLYLLCTHEFPFPGETTIETLMAIALNTPKSPELIRPSMPNDLARLVMELLEKDPKRRPSSTDQVIERLEQIESFLSHKEWTNPTSDALIGSSSVHEAKSLRERFKPPFKIGLALMCVFAASWASWSILFWQTPNGRIVRVESNDPTIEIALGNNELKIVGAYSHPVIVQPGKVELKIKKSEENGGEFVFETNKLIVTKGDEIALRIELLDGQINLERIGKGLIDSKSLPKKSLSNKLVDGTKLTPDHRGALWALSHGGSIILNNNDVGIHFEDQLPRGNYKVTHVVLTTILTVTDEGIANLSGLTDLQELNLGHTKVSNEGLKHLSQLRNMRWLNLHGTQVTDEGILELKDMEKLTCIGLGGGLQITDSTLIQLRRFQELKNLFLDGSQITDAGMPLLRKIGILEVLDLGATQVSDIGLDSVMYIESLRELILYGTKLTDETMIRLGQLRKLQVLNLWNTSLTDEGLDRLHGLVNLRMLHLKGTKVTAEGLNRMHLAVPECTIDHDGGVIAGRLGLD